MIFNFIFHFHANRFDSVQANQDRLVKHSDPLTALWDVHPETSAMTLVPRPEVRMVLRVVPLIILVAE